MTVGNTHHPMILDACKVVETDVRVLIGLLLSRYIPLPCLNAVLDDGPFGTSGWLPDSLDVDLSLLLLGNIRHVIFYGTCFYNMCFLALGSSSMFILLLILFQIFIKLVLLNFSDLLQVILFEVDGRLIRNNMLPRELRRVRLKIPRLSHRLSEAMQLGRAWLRRVVNQTQVVFWNLAVKLIVTPPRVVFCMLTIVVHSLLAPAHARLAINSMELELRIIVRNDL